MCRTARRLGAVAATVVVGASAALADDVAIRSPDGPFEAIGPVFFETQTDEVNVSGIVQTSNLPLADVLQTGDYNRAAIAQSGTDPIATIDQLGTYNRALIVQQTGTTDALTNQDGNHNVAITLQSGLVNTSVTNQAGVDNFVVTLQGAAATPIAALNESELRTLVVNFLYAPETVQIAPELAEIKALGFNSRLIGHMNAHPQGFCQTNIFIAKDGAEIPVTNCESARFFAGGGYRSADQDARLGVLGFDGSVASGYFGGEVPVWQNGRIGAAFEYARASADIGEGVAVGETRIDSYQFGLFGDIRRPNGFVAAAFTYGINDYDISRPGFGSPVGASPDGRDFTGSIEAGYLFDLRNSSSGRLQLGPVGKFAAADTKVDSFVENGDPLLAQRVPQTTSKALLGTLGLRLQYERMFAGYRINGFTSIAVEHDFETEDFEVLTTEFVAFDGAPIVTPVDPLGDRTYMRLSSGFTVAATDRLEATLLTESAFFDDTRDNEWAVTGELALRF